MKKVYILGAGASHGYMDSESKQRPPLARDFLKVFNELNIEYLVRIGMLLNYFTTSYPDRDYWDMDLEKVMSELDNKILCFAERVQREELNETETREFLESTGAYAEIISLISKSLDRIQQGPLYTNYEKLVSICKSTDYIISLNWDTLLDRALFESGQWFVDDGYGVEFHAILEGEWREQEVTRKSSIKLLKPHGSINWFAPYMSRQPFTGKLLIGVKEANKIDLQSIPLYCLIRTRGKPGYKDKVCVGDHLTCINPPNAPEYNIPLSPLIVPPTPNKLYGEYGILFNNIWKSMADRIEEADEINVIGYSFPETDNYFLDILRKNNNSKLKIINPDSSRISKMLVNVGFDKHNIEEEESFEEFLNNN